MIRCVLFSVFLLMFSTAEASGKAEVERNYCGYTEHDTADERFAWKFCCLCKDCDYPPVERIGWFVDSNNKTCRDYDSEFIGQIPNQSEYCYEMQNHHRDTCCNLTCEAKKIKQVWKPVSYPYEQGPEPFCNLCKKGQFPTKPYTITTIAGIPGHNTCENLYWMGRTGNIPARTCYPMQLHMHGPCGCAKPPEPPTGMEPYCQICPNGDYPLRPKIRINELPQAPSCRELYWQGRAWQLTPAVCNHLKREGQGPCGCVLD